MQTASYVFGCPPTLPATLFDNARNHLQQFATVSKAETRLIHASIPSDIFIEQGRHIANLSQWLEILDHDVPAF